MNIIELSITIYSHSVVVVPKSDRAKKRVAAFLDNYKKYKYERKMNRFIKTLDKIFVAFTKDKKKYRFSINQIRSLVSFLRRYGIEKENIKIRHVRTKRTKKLNIESSESMTPHSYQERYIDYLFKDDNVRAKLLSLQTGKGKELWGGTKLLTPKGKRCIDTLRVGDYVLSPQLKPIEVIGHFLQGRKTMYKITFNDGRSVLAGLKHQWKVYINNKSRIVRTIELMRLLKDSDCYIDLVSPEINKQQQTSTIMLLETLSRHITKFTDITSHISIDVYSPQERYELFSTLADKLKSTYRGKCFIKCKEDIGEVLVELARSIGGEAYYSNDKVYYTFTPKRLKVKSIVRDKMLFAYCITVDDPGSLYVVEDYIVTHNTYTALKAVCDINIATGIIVLPKYISKWVEDIKYNTTAVEKDIMSIRGRDQLRKLMVMAKSKETTPPFIIFSNRTLLNYIKDYEEANWCISKHDYPIVPERLFGKLGIGVILMDEVHQDFYGNFKMMLYFNVGRLIGLSATLFSNDRFMNSVYGILFPEIDRPKKLKYDAYVNLYPVKYKLTKPGLVRSSNFATSSYSHIAFEQSIIRYKPLLWDYLNMICYYAKVAYVDRRKPGEKLAIFAGSVEMCTIITKMLRQKIRECSIERYVQDDPYENIINPDIRVTTVISGGTAIDIPGLITVLQTINVSSLQSNLQTFGRLRRIKDRSVEFYYFYTTDVPKHVKYHNDRIAMLKNKVKSIEEISYDHMLG